MAEELTLQDLEKGRLAIHEIVLLGKKAHIRELTFQQVLDAADVKDDEPVAAACRMVAVSLCDSEGVAMFDDLAAGASTLAPAIPAQELFALTTLINTVNGLDVEAEAKN